jgi:hypothetical protein
MKRAGLLLLVALLALGPPASAQQSRGFTPCTISQSSISVNTGSQNVQLSTCGPTAILYNLTTQEIFYKLGATASTTATTSDNSLPGSSYVVLNVPFAGSAGFWIAAIAAANSSTLRIVQGVAN